MMWGNIHSTYYQVNNILYNTFIILCASQKKNEREKREG